MSEPKRYPPDFQAVVDGDPEDYYAWSLRRAREKGGDGTHAEDLLHGFCSAIEQGKPIPRPILDFLHAGFAAFLTGNKKLESALLLTKQRGRPDDSSRIRIRDGRIYTSVVIAALLQIMIKQGRGLGAREAALAILEERRIAPARSAERYNALHNFLADSDWTPQRLRALIRDERQVAKGGKDLTKEQRKKLRH